MEWKQSLHPEWEVSEYGQMRALTDRYRRPAGTVITGAVNKGYAYYSLTLPGESGRGAGRFRHYAHTLVLTAFVGPCPPDKTQCAHYDGDPRNNHFSNLRWATAAENTADKVRHGMNRMGNKKFSEDQVLDMRAMRSRGCSYGAIIEKYNVSQGNLSSIINRNTWDHLPAQ